MWYQNIGTTYTFKEVFLKYIYISQICQVAILDEIVKQEHNQMVGELSRNFFKKMLA